MNVTSTRPGGRVHYPAASGTPRPQCMPPRSTYRTTASFVTCERCLARPSILDELGDVADMAHSAVTLAERTAARAQAALDRTVPDTPAHLVAKSALHAVRASKGPAERAWHAAAAAYIATARALRAPGRMFPLDAIERGADLPEVAALLAAHEAN